LTYLIGNSQDVQNTIHVSGQVINLDSVSLLEGILIDNDSTIRKDKWGERESTCRIRLFTCLNKSHYAIVYDTNTNLEGGQYTKLQLWSQKGEMLFDKYFPNLVITNCYISSSGEIIGFNLSSIDAEEVHFYKSDGSQIAKYDNGTDIYTGDWHKYFFKMKGNKSDNTYDLIDYSGNISEIQFPNGFVKHVEFSKGEYYYRLIVDQDQLLFDLDNHQLIWKIPLNFGNINFLTEETTISVTRSTNTLEIRKILDQEVLHSVNSIDYNGQKLGFFYYGLIDDHFYLVERIKGKWIFAIYNFNCEQVYYDFVNIRMTPSDYNVSKNGDKFDIIIKKERDY
jgi:hypothetical protein